MSLRSSDDTALPAQLHPFARPSAPKQSFVNLVSGRGAEVTDGEGRTYVDALASLWYCNIGHGRPEMAEAVAAQMRRLEAFHTFDRFTNPVADELAERLAALAPMDNARVFFTSGGSDAVESAVKMARLAHHLSGRPDKTLIVSRSPSYHGVNYAAMSATGIALNREGFGPLLPDVIQVPHDDLAALDQLPASTKSRVAAVIAEPVIGAGGVFPAAPGYLSGLRQRCDEWGAFLIADEVICGFGRLGQWWGSQYYGARPDLVTFAKGVTSGYLPLGGVLVGPNVRSALEENPGTVLRHGYTYSGHPTVAAAGLANIDIIEREDLLSKAKVIEACLGEGLKALVDGRQVLGVRGTMGMWALILAPDVEAPLLRDALLGVGVIARPIGTGALAYCPPLVVTEEQMERCVNGTARALASL